MEKIALIGGLGTVGQILLRHLSHQYEFIIVDVGTSDHLPSIHADVSNYQSLQNAIPKDTDILFDLTAYHMDEQATGREDFENMKQTYIQGIYNIFEVAKSHGIKKVIYASSIHVNGLDEKDGLSLTGKKISIYNYPKPDMVYGAMKLFGESVARLYAQQHQIKAICLRFGFTSIENIFFKNPRFSRIILYHEDLAKIVKAAFESNSEFGIYHAVSENAQNPYDLRPLRKGLNLKRSDFIARKNSSFYHKIYMKVHRLLLKKK